MLLCSCFPLTAAAPVFSAGRAPESRSKPSIGKITGILQSRLDAFTGSRAVPGATLSVRWEDGTSISLASGLADREDNLAMRPDAIMFSGSVGKTYVAAVILKLYEQGVIDLQARAEKYLREEAWFSRLANAGEVTVEMLLNHTAGVPEYVYKKELWQEMRRNPDKIWSVGERLSYIFADQPVHEPGKGWAYADAHYLILGRIIEKVTGKPYYDVLDELILKPCRLEHTSPADQRSLPGLVAGYTKLTEDFLLPPKVSCGGTYAFNPQLEWTGGGLVTNVSDLTSWASQLYGGSVLKPETKMLLLTPAPYPTTLSENARYGLGTFIGASMGIAYYGHTGFVPGFVTIVHYLPLYHIAIALQINTDDLRGTNVLLDFFNDLKSAVLENRPAGKKQAVRGRTQMRTCAKNMME